MSGVEVCDEVKNIFDRMKKVKQGGDQSDRLRLVVFRVCGKNIDVTETMTNKQCAGKDVYTIVRKHLREKDCCYILYDCHYRTVETSDHEDLILLTWCHENATIKSKMIYSSSKPALKKALNGIKLDLELTDFSDCSRKEFLTKLGKGEKLLSLEGRDCDRSDSDSDDDEEEHGSDHEHGKGCEKSGDKRQDQAKGYGVKS
ncbi:non-muscle cofilin 1-like [Antennarius striatus]|uniref:non-muscle cofilin 1-like n=1 Tax=Antennarius striatus TaxID=241820 RepID=UPI0035B0F66D